MRVIDAGARPPFAATLPMGLYARGGGMTSRIKRGQPPDRALQQGSLSLFLEECRAAGIVRTVINAKAAGPGFNPQDPPEGLPNEAVAGLVRENPDRFSATASFDVVGDPRALDAAEAALATGFVGIALYPGYMPTPADCDDPRLFPMYELCSAKGTPVIVMAGGWAGPDLSYSDPVHVDRVAATFPQLKLVVMHGGSPFAQAIVGVLYRRSNVWLMPDMYFPGGSGEADYMAAMRTYARDRFVFASAYPSCPLRDQLERVCALPLPASAIDCYLYRNAASLYGLRL